MAGLIGDSEKQRVMDRIMCISFRQAGDAGASFINRNWIAEKLGRTSRWVTDNWNKSPQECFTQFGEGSPEQSVPREPRNHRRVEQRGTKKPSTSRSRNSATSW
jgi:hypothetical protein